MDKKSERPDVYILPPNFMDKSTCFSGMFRLRNAIEAAVVAVLIGVPVLQLSLSFTAKIIILCLTALPIGLFALVGVNGESLTSFIYNFFTFLKNRRKLYRSDVPEESEENSRKRKSKKKTHKGIW